MKMKTYIITRMYAGSYLSDNLGGEAINLLHDDHNHNYIFVGPYGFIDKKYDDTVEGVILTRLEKAGCFQILGIAKVGKGDQISYQNGPTLKKRFENGKAKITIFAEENDIRYGGVSLMKINGGAFFGADITFKSKALLLPKNDLYISDSHTSDFKMDGYDVINLDDKRFPKQSLHSYITDIDNPHAFDEITKLINDDSLWDKDRINKIEDNKVVDKHFNFLDVIHKDFDELSYSNLFSYIFKTYPEAFIRFSKEVLGVDLSSNYKVFREKANIDLYIEDESNIVVIENKIKSGINGIRHDFSEKGLIQSQLLKYYEFVENEKEDKKASYFLFVPNYNKLDLKQYSGSQHYKEIRYSEIYDFFRKIDIKDTYYQEFVKALYKHTKDREVDFAEDMAVRFLDKIRKLK